MKKVSRQIYRLELINLIANKSFIDNFLWGVTMIRNNDLVKTLKIGHYVCKKCLSYNVLHNDKFNQLVTPLDCLFRQRYRTGSLKYISFVTNRHIV